MGSEAQEAVEAWGILTYCSYSMMEGGGAAGTTKLMLLMN